jgi:Cu/Ag efflux protein CusF
MANFNGEHVTKLTQLYNMLMGLWNSAKGLFATQAELTRVEQSIPDAQVQSDWDETDTDSKAYIKHKPNIPEMQVQSDWTETDTSSKAYIKHKPENLVQDASYVHTDNNFTTAEKNKLSGIEAGAQVNVQADWNQSNSSADDYIKNKPENLVQDADYVHTDNNFTTAEKSKLEGIEAGAEVNVQADWNQTNSSADDYIKNKPENLVQDASYVHTDNNFTTAEKNKLSGIEAGAEVNVQADWSQSDTTADDYIKNKPSNATITTDGFMSAADKTKLNGIAAGAEVNVQSDWTQNDTSADDYIKHKPELYGLISGTGINLELNESEQVVISANNDPQVQSDWTETNTSSKAYIQNKPSFAAVAYTGSYSSLTGKPDIRNVPDVASADNGKVLTAEYSGGVGSYSWQVAPISLPPSTSSDEGKTLVVDSNGDPSWDIIQSDWSQSDNTANDYIKNKPTNMPLKAGNRITFAYVDDQLEISAAAASQVQADWSQADSSAIDYIKNKPSIPVIGTITL